MNNPQKKIEAEVIMLAGVRSGCKRAFEQIYSLYKFRVYSAIRKQINDTAAAEELTQDVFVKIWEKKTQLDLEKSFAAYVFRIANSRVVDYCRKLKRDKEIINNMLLIATEISDEPMESDFSKDENDCLQNAIDELSPQRKKIFILCKLEGKSYEEVGKLMGVSTSTISDHIVKATKSLRKNMVMNRFVYCLFFVPSLFISIKPLLEKII